MRSVGGFAVLAAAAGVHAGPNCAQYTDCKTCAAVNDCGWCSEPVVFQDGSPGQQCVSPTEGKAFTCPALYSTTQCIEGWICDSASGACRQALPGQGVDRPRCESACTVGPVDKVYGCINGSNTCTIVPPGTAGSGSRDDCNAHCFTPSAKVYACQGASGSEKCVVVPAGTAGSSSKDVCEARGCDAGFWFCDLATFTCRETPGKQGGKSQPRCTEGCKAESDPCENHYTCTDCLAAGPMCGWCSVNVTYENGKTGTQCAGVRSDILPFQCPGSYSTTACAAPPAPPAPTPAPAGPSPLPPNVLCPPGSEVLLQYSCPDSSCGDCAYVGGKARECLQPECTYFCSGKCYAYPQFTTSLKWTCNNPSGGDYTNATLVHWLQSTDCTGPTNPAGIGGSGSFPLDTCNGIGPNVPPQYNTFRCVPCGDACKH